MGARYVFWRTPDGKVYRGIDQKHAQIRVLAELSKIATRNPNGSISWSPFIYQLETSLKPTLAIIDPDSDELNGGDSWEIIKRAVRSWLEKTPNDQPTNPQDFIGEADRHAAAYFRQPLNDYILVTLLSVKSLPAKVVKLQHSIVRGLSGRGTRYPLPKVIKHQHSDFMSRAKKCDGKYISVAVSGRSIHAATHRALYDLTLLRGLWSLFSGYRSWSIAIGVPSQKSLGMIHSGPLYTLHTPDGKPVDDVFWSDAEFKTDAVLFQPTNGWERIEKNRRWAHRRLSALLYRRDLEEILVRYAVALDQTNVDVAFIHLWSILEKVTGTVGGRYDETVKRAVWFFDDRDLAAEMLGAMRLHRNRLVHSARSGDDQDQPAYLVKRFVEPHIIHLLRNDFRITRLDEYGQRLALPTDASLLRRERARLDSAIKLIENKKKP